jgi:CRISPR-associated protein Cas2
MTGTDRQTWLIAYDIRQPARLRRVHKYLSRLGYALQYSLFVADLNDAEFEQAKQELENRADTRFDDVRMYCLARSPSGNWSGPLPGDCDVAIYGSPAAILVDTLFENPLVRPKNAL